MVVNMEGQLPVPRRLNWMLLSTGGLVFTGGLGWCLRLAYAGQPKTTIAATLAGSAGACLVDMAFYRHSKNSYISSNPNWWLLLTGGILAWTGLGCCLILALKEYPKATALAYTAGSVSYAVANAAILNDPTFENSKKTPNSLYGVSVSAKEIADAVNSANARFHYMGDAHQCQKCKVYVEKEIKERKEAKSNLEEISQ